MFYCLHALGEGNNATREKILEFCAMVVSTPSPYCNPVNKYRLQFTDANVCIDMYDQQHE